MSARGFEKKEKKQGFYVQLTNSPHLILWLHGIGEVILEDEDALFNVPYVAYAPEININVLSIKQLILQGFEVKIEGNACTIVHMGKHRQITTMEQPVAKEKGNFLEINGKLVPIIIKNFENFMSFMMMVHKDRVCYSNKRLFEKKFDEAVEWFFEMKNGSQIALPPYLAGLHICLFDFYKLVSNSGGFDTITKEGNLDEIAMSHGYPEEFGEDFKHLYTNYLLLPQAFLSFRVKKRLITYPVKRVFTSTSQIHHILSYGCNFLLHWM